MSVSSYRQKRTFRFPSLINYRILKFDGNPAPSCLRKDLIILYFLVTIMYIVCTYSGVVKGI